MNMGKENFELEQYISCKIDAIDVENKNTWKYLLSFSVKKFLQMIWEIH